MLSTPSELERGASSYTSVSDTLTFLQIVGAFCDTPFTNAAQAIATALEIVMQRVGVRTAFVTHITNGQAKVVGVNDNQGCNISAGALVPLENTFCQYVRATDRPVVIPNSAFDARVQQIPARFEFNMVAYIGVPIHLRNGEIYGTLCALDPEPQAFLPEHVELMRILAQRVASLIELEQTESQHANIQREAEAALASARQALEQQTTVMSVVAHDLRTPLTSVRGFVELMVNDVFGPVWPKQREALDRISANVQWMQRLSNDMLDVASLDAKTFSMLNGNYSPYRIAQNIAELCQIQARDRGLQLQFTGDETIPEIVGDADRMQQVLLNLATNALRYTERGEVRITVLARPDGAEFRITDTGPGICAEQRERIWQRGVRASSVGRGTGLGLYVVKQLVAAMGGTVGVQSEVGRGSTFWVRIPSQGPAPHVAAWQ